MKDFEGRIPPVITFGAPQFHYLLMPQAIVFSAKLERVITKPQPGKRQNPNHGSQQPNTGATVTSFHPYNLGVGSRVQASMDVSEPPHYGVIRWIGEIAGASGTIAGIELVSLYIVFVLFTPFKSNKTG